MRGDSLVDGLIVEFDKALRTLFVPVKSVRVMPGSELPVAELSDSERHESAGLMRVNHSGEVCAQALYRGQALACRNDSVRSALEHAASEEGDHLAWTERRLFELNGRKSALNPLWYAASYSIGLVAGKFGDAWSLGFLAETERQVESHLLSHQQRLPERDRQSWAIIDQMKADEIGHSHLAERLGARDLPKAVKAAMRVASGVMTRTAYWV
ncbi:MAG: 2-nonaprenyl-3-methyl-6-methoxy-1,4-benzoquinol hydroxylase [Rhodocyclaceae bacterium]|nr:2-nonaprenyl-3-methyl-6-methoxy-1,4-benzoquinol hydroxylase [Rhodocyclaceae bacterium]